MHPHEGDPPRAAPPLWSTPEDDLPDVAATRPQTSYRYLLDVDKDLADEFDLRMRIVVRRVASVVVFDIPIGDFDLGPWFDTGPNGLGLLLLDGALAVDTRVGGRTATELVGAGDLLQAWDTGEDHLIERQVSCRALMPVRIAVLDGAFAERVRPWPQIVHALLRRSGERASRLAEQRAIMSQPRLEVRLALLLWEVAERWGRVEPGGVHLELPLTHALLGRLAGAERPSVSHALARLASAGMVTGLSGDWHLHGNVDEQLASLLEGPVERLTPRARQRRGGSRSAARGA